MLINFKITMATPVAKPDMARYMLEIPRICIQNMSMYIYVLLLKVQESSLQRLVVLTCFYS